MSASLSDHAARLLGRRGTQRRELLVASLAAGFGAVFGVPVAGAVFALEVQTVGRLRFEAVLACFTAAFTGDQIVRWLGYEHTRVAPVIADDRRVAGPARRPRRRRVRRRRRAVRLDGPPGQGHRGRGSPTRRSERWSEARSWPLAIAVLGHDYESLSSPLAATALAGQHVAALAWFAKAALTAVCLGVGIPGGEVTPLFVTGALLGAALAGPLGLPVALLAAIGFVAVFAGAANTPIACTLLFVELFGAGAVVAAAMACAVAYVCSGHSGIYTTQRIEIRKHA